VGPERRRHSRPSAAVARGKIAAATAIGLVGTVAAESDEKTVGENSSLGEKTVGENPKSTVGEKSPAKNQKPLQSSNKDFSPTHFSPTRKADFSPTPTRYFSPTPGREFSPTKKPKLALVRPSKNGRRGRPRNPELPPAPGKYFYWGKARNGLKLERRKPEYEYIGFIMPNEWEHLRGNFDEEYILRAIIAAIRVKRARAAQGRRPRTLTA
jgi:hypothetical protein